MDLRLIAEMYDPSSNTWDKVRQVLKAYVMDHTATLLPSGMVLIAGGNSNGVTALSSTSIYNPASNTSSSGPNLSTARYDHTATLLPNGKVLVVGGTPDQSQTAFSSVELYDPSSNTWSAGGTLINARYYHTATLLPNGKVLVAEAGT